MNKTLILAAAATLIAMTGSAQAQQATGKITTNATLMEACAFPAGDLVLNFPSVYTNVGEDQSVSGSMTVPLALTTLLKLAARLRNSLPVQQRAN